MHVTSKLDASDATAKLYYIYEHFQDAEKVHESDPDTETQVPDNTLYSQINNDVEYGIFETIIDNYYLDSQIKDGFLCDKECTKLMAINTDQVITSCTYDYLNMLHNTNIQNDPIQQHRLYTAKENASLFTSNTTLPCTYNIIQDLPPNTFDTEEQTPDLQNTGLYSHRKHKFCNTFGEAHIQYHDFKNVNALTFNDKYAALLQQELQNPSWCLHDRITTKTYQISTNMDIKTMPHAMYFSGNPDTGTKINHVSCQTITYDDKGMFQAYLMDETQSKFS